jgi:hypothetical protein
MQVSGAIGLRYLRVDELADAQLMKRHRALLGSNKAGNQSDSFAQAYGVVIIVVDRK